MKTVCIEKFFVPSSQLTQRLTQTMREQALRDLQQSIGPLEGANQGEFDGAEPWTDLLQAVDEGRKTTKEGEADQRWLGEILYGYLARLAHSHAPLEGASFGYVEAILPGMSSRLGLDDSEGLALLKEFAIEFQRWLKKRPAKTFEAGWGVICVDPADPERFGVKRFPALTDQDPEPQPASAAAPKALSAGAGSLRSWFATILRSDR